MKSVQQVRGKWVVRVVVPEELRGIAGQRELVEIGLPTEARAREKHAFKAINAFHAKLDEAREVWESLGEASKPTLSSAAKEHYRSELLQDDLERATFTTTDASNSMTFFRTVYANKLRLLVADKLVEEKAEALIGYAVDTRRREGRASNVPRKRMLGMMAEIQLEALERFEERDRGQVRGSAPAHPLLTEPDPVPKSMTGAWPLVTIGMTLTDTLDAFHKERRSAGGGTLAARTMEENRSAVRTFNEFMGGEAPLGATTKKQVIAYEQALLDTPIQTRRLPLVTLLRSLRANAGPSDA